MRGVSTRNSLGVAWGVPSPSAGNRVRIVERNPARLVLGKLCAFGAQPLDLVLRQLLAQQRLQSGMGARFVHLTGRLLCRPAVIGVSSETGRVRVVPRQRGSQCKMVERALEILFPSQQQA